MKSRATLIIGLAHAVVVSLLSVAALLLTSDWPALAAFAGVRRAALGLYLIANATLIETYIVTRNLLPRAPLHFTAVQAGLSANEVLLRSFALVNIGLAIGAVVLAERERWWLAAFAALGIYAFNLSITFPDQDRSREWTIGEIIRHYAQESKRYARWLSLMQYVYGAASILIWLMSVALLFAVVGVGANFVHAAFLAPSDPTWPQLGETTWTAAENIGAWIARVLPVMGAAALTIVFASAVFQAVVQWWTRPARPRDPLSDAIRREL